MKIGKFEFDFEKKTYICGIINATPDSFSDGGKNLSAERAAECALKMIEEGAHIIDIGGESTRPGYTPVDVDEELARVIPVIRSIRRKSDIPISIDTTKAAVAEAAIAEGADIVNDVSGLLADEKMTEVIKRYGVHCAVTHNESYVNRLRDCNVGQVESYVNQYNPGDFSCDSSYVNQVCKELLLLTERAESFGIARDKIILDPGIGFKGFVERDHLILDNLPVISQTGYPILLGASRKSCIGALCGDNMEDRDLGTVVVSSLATLSGVAIIRVHDVRRNVMAVKMLEEICKYG